MFISTNQYGYNIDKISASGLNLNLDTGTFWFNLQNASVPSGDPVYWDENSGVGCGSPGCPSQAQESSVGTIPSESFTMLGNGNGPPPECFESQGKLQIIYSFTPQQGGGNGVAIDKTGNLYGTTGGGDNGAGFAYKLAHFAGWLLDPLFSFFGGYNGGPPFGAIVGPNGSLYGGAQGGIQNCGIGGSQYCGIVFNLTPQPTACLTAMCSWTENVPYRFTGGSDGAYLAGQRSFPTTLATFTGRRRAAACRVVVTGSGAALSLSSRHPVEAGRKPPCTVSPEVTMAPIQPRFW